MKKYLITDPVFYPRSPAAFSRAFSSAFTAHHPHFCCLRDKTNRFYPQLAKRFLFQGQRFKTKMLLHGDWRLAKKLGAHGVHLASKQARQTRLAVRAGLITVVSCHTIDEARKALGQGAHFVTLSPVFDSPGKGTALGVEFLKGLEGKIRDKTIALGGIVSSVQIEALASCGVAAFASIRYFVQKEN